VERAYVDLLLVRDQLALLARLESLWAQSEGLARVRYEAGGDGAVRSTACATAKESSTQQRWALQAEESRRIAVLNRLRGHPLTEPIATTPPGRPAGPGVARSRTSGYSGRAESPELKKALLAGEQAGRRVELANNERWPDVTVSAG